MRAELPQLVSYKGYISQSLFEQLFKDGIHFITKLRKNMNRACELTEGKNSLMHLSDKIILRKGALIEPVCDELKYNLPDSSQVCQIEHTRHRIYQRNLL